MNDKKSVARDRVNRALDWASAQGGMWHQAGNLHTDVLRTIARHVERTEAHVTAETGCGLSTIILSALAECHICFTVAEGNPLHRVETAPRLRRECVTFVIGPSQLTLPRYSFARPLDFALIDGAHAFPIPQLDYFYFYQHIRRGGILVIDDFHIPIVRQMYDFLRDDKMWTHLEDVMTTAFFQRSDEPMFDPLGGSWQEQQFNQRHFSDQAMMDIISPGWAERALPPPGPLLGAGSKAVPDSPALAADDLRATVARLRLESDSLKLSTSWRVTAPFRAISSVLRRRGRGVESRADA